MRGKVRMQLNVGSSMKGKSRKKECASIYTDDSCDCLEKWKAKAVLLSDCIYKNVVI